MTTLNFAEVRLLQEASGATSGQVYVDGDARLSATAQKLVDAGLGVLAYGHFIVNQAGAATACMWPKAAA
ncbi:MAG TPA: hypothetical protein VFN92_08160 [Solirubrobacterales bacterium]|nr:hypothetical protein [Solirubrobacterales bacterium]